MAPVATERAGGALSDSNGAIRRQVTSFLPAPQALLRCTAPASSSAVVGTSLAVALVVAFRTFVAQIRTRYC
jgi:hypothetical protein